MLGEALEISWRTVGERHTDAVREVGQRDAPIVEQVVELDGDRHVTPPLRGPGACARAFLHAGIAQEP
jgi:hypothetical protein